MACGRAGPQAFSSAIIPARAALAQHLRFLCGCLSRRRGPHRRRAAVAAGYSSGSQPPASEHVARQEPRRPRVPKRELGNERRVGVTLRVTILTRSVRSTWVHRRMERSSQSGRWMLDARYWVAGLPRGGWRVSRAGLRAVEGRFWPHERCPQRESEEMAFDKPEARRYGGAERREDGADQEAKRRNGKAGRKSRRRPYPARRVSGERQVSSEAPRRGRRLSSASRIPRAMRFRAVRGGRRLRRRRGAGRRVLRARSAARVRAGVRERRRGRRRR